MLPISKLPISMLPISMLPMRVGGNGRAASAFGAGCGAIFAAVSDRARLGGVMKQAQIGAVETHPAGRAFVSDESRFPILPIVEERLRFYFRQRESRRRSNALHPNARPQCGLRK